MSKSFYAHSEIESIADESLQQLFEEIATLRNIPKTGLVVQFLHQALVPFPPMNPRKFKRLELIPGSLLRKKVRDFASCEIYKLCIDLASISKIGSIENHNGLSLFGLLNKIYVDHKKTRSNSR